MKFVHTIIFFALKRLWSHRWLGLCLGLGLIAAVAFVVAVPVYSDGISNYIMTNTANTTDGQSRLQPFDFVFRYVGTWYGGVTPERYRLVDQYFNEQVADQIGLPLIFQNRYLATTNFSLSQAVEDMTPSGHISFVKLAFFSGIFDHIQITDGALPQFQAEKDGPIEVAVSLEMANKLDLKVGQTYFLQSSPDNRQTIIIVGIWIPVDAAEEFWSLYPVNSFETKLLTEEAAWWSAVSDHPNPVEEATWWLSFDGSVVSSGGIARLLARIDSTQNQVNALLPNTVMETSPAPALRQYRTAAASLAGTQFAFNAPILGLVLLFLLLTARQFVGYQRNEIAVLRSRGASRTWILAVYFIEWLILGIGALIIGLPLAAKFSELIGRTNAFLDFSGYLPFSVNLSLRDLWFGLAAMLVAMGCCLYPVFVAGRDTIVSLKLRQPDSNNKSVWQQLYLDVALLIVALYGLYTLRSTGQLVFMDRSFVGADPYQNPVMFLLPALLIIGLCLLSLRVIPVVLEVLSHLAERLQGVLPVLVMRQVARSGQTYQGTLLLISLTLAVAVFISSMAYSLDSSVSRNIYYRIGADLNLSEGANLYLKWRKVLIQGCGISFLFTITYYCLGYKQLLAWDVTTHPLISRVALHEELSWV